ncbi:amino acid transporter [Lepidopterella palustris CBS 459.81]|uniref:Amino acid transporter n=1 Tax=Lepidopterella palustris CBS 459.81 TaxID=1314670 RepID=A0A8E2JH97_9PEZI|nr:amino acid transporter [Lepidopterella palustris CBS 459.81]
METFADEAAYTSAFAARDRDHERFDIAPPGKQRIGSFTVVCLVLNRTIGSGIFLTPARVLKGTGSVGVSLLLWAFGGLYGFAGLDCWLQLGLSIPFYRIPTGEQKNVPRSGGEKNYIEYMFSKFKILPTCMYGIPFILLGNLSGNAIAFGMQVLRAAGYPDSEQQRGAITGLAIGVLALCASLHIFSRRGGILISNLFAMLKILILLTIIVLGFIKAGGGLASSTWPSGIDNFKTSTSFKIRSHDVASYVDSIFFICYTYSGFEQPFYVLSEVDRPREVFPIATNIAWAIATVLFLLTNIAYFCAVPISTVLGNGPDSNLDMATLFFKSVFEDERAQRGLAAIVAICIFGNILVMTFTAARVKQEISKEGILPFSLFFATSRTTPWAWLQKKFRSKPTHNDDREENQERHYMEHTPMAALVLHFLSSVFLVAVTSMLKPDIAYSVLISLYSYVLVTLIGFIISGGLLYLKWAKFLNWGGDRGWNQICDYKSWLDPAPAVLYFFASGFFIFASFAKPADSSPYSRKVSGLPWWVVPTIGLSSLLWGVVWYVGFKLYSRIVNKELEKIREPFIMPVRRDRPDGHWIQRSEMVSLRWVTRFKSAASSMRDREGGSLHSGDGD